MEFTTKIGSGGKTAYFIDGKHVSEKAYYTLLEDQRENESEECNECPKCSIIREIAEELINCDSVDEMFSELHELVDFFEEMAFEAGYRDTLDNQIEILQDIRSQIDEED